MVSNIYTANIAGDEMVKYVRDRNNKTGEERILEPHELKNPDYVDKGDEQAFKVSILSNKVFKSPDTY